MRPHGFPQDTPNPHMAQGYWAPYPVATDWGSVAHAGSTWLMSFIPLDGFSLHPETSLLLNQILPQDPLLAQKMPHCNTPWENQGHAVRLYYVADIVNHLPNICSPFFLPELHGLAAPH